MKWGTKKSPSNSLISRVLSGSWLSRLRRPKSGSTFDADSVKNKQRSELGFPTRTFYSLDDEDDSYWTFSFQQGRKSTGGIGINPLWYDDNNSESPVSDECLLNFSDMILDVKRMKQMKGKSQIGSENHQFETKPPKTKVKQSKKGLKKERKKYRKEGGVTMFDSFAMVKSSFNPEKDFRDSMVEMIQERRIERQDELEQLLACYLTFNRDEYHDMIIDVFRQVWSEMKQ